jgi:hypothetical protein
VEDALWAALRSLEENATMARRMAHRFSRSPHTASLGERYEQKARMHDRHAADLRRLLTAKRPVEQVPQEEPQAG